MFVEGCFHIFLFTDGKSPQAGVLNKLSLDGLAKLSQLR